MLVKITFYLHEVVDYLLWNGTAERLNGLEIEGRLVEVRLDKRE